MVPYGGYYGPPMGEYYGDYGGVKDTKGTLVLGTKSTMGP
jgi:hypothetical protein